jgi:hypothetical protein
MCDPELAHEPRSAPFNGGTRELQLLGDLSIVLPFDKAPQDLSLGFRKQRQALETLVALLCGDAIRCVAIRRASHKSDSAQDRRKRKSTAPSCIAFTTTRISMSRPSSLTTALCLPYLGSLEPVRRGILRILSPKAKSVCTLFPSRKRAALPTACKLT